jgi:hypothetical protein
MAKQGFTFNVTIERSETTNSRRFRCNYRLTTPTDVIVRQDNTPTLWKKFMPGQVMVTCEAWYKGDELIIGKIIRKS